MEMITFYGEQSAEFVYSNLHIFTRTQTHSFTQRRQFKVCFVSYHFGALSLFLAHSHPLVLTSHSMMIKISSRWTFNMWMPNSIEYNLIIIWTRSNYSNIMKRNLFKTNKNHFISTHTHTLTERYLLVVWPFLPLILYHRRSFLWLEQKKTANCTCTLGKIGMHKTGH